VDSFKKFQQFVYNYFTAFILSALLREQTLVQIFSWTNKFEQPLLSL